ncbi:MAG: hypothetical protein AAGF95_34480, partial [Chloroflexota bacterium]
MTKETAQHQRGTATMPTHSLGLRSFLLWEEVRTILTWARERELWLVLLAGLVLWTLAYQWPYTHQLDVGGNRVERTRGFDAPFVGTSFNASEPASLR